MEDRPIDLRVEDDPDPVRELRQLLSLRRTYQRVDVGDQLAAAGDVEGSLAEYERPHRSQPDNLELAFWHGVALAASGREEDAAPILRRAFQAHAGWIELLKRLPAAGLFPDDGELIARLIGTRAVSEPESGRPRLCPLAMFHDRARIYVRGGGGGTAWSPSGARPTCPRAAPTAATAAAAATCWSSDPLARPLRFPARRALQRQARRPWPGREQARRHRPGCSRSECLPARVEDATRAIAGPGRARPAALVARGAAAGVGTSSSPRPRARAPRFAGAASRVRSARSTSSCG